MNAKRCVVLVLISIIMTGCVAPSTVVTSNKAENYTHHPKRIFVLADIYNVGFGEKFFDAFRTTLTAIAKDCGAALMVSRIDSLNLDENIYEKQANAFNADTLLAVRRNGGLVTHTTTIEAKYDVRLLDIPSQKTVWRASAVFTPNDGIGGGQKYGEVLAIDITNKLKEDKIFTGCDIIRPNDADASQYRPTKRD